MLWDLGNSMVSVDSLFVEGHAAKPKQELVVEATGRREKLPP